MPRGFKWCHRDTKYRLKLTSETFTIIMCHRDIKEIAVKSIQPVVQILVRTSEENRDWLKAKALDQDRSVNWIINKILDEVRRAEGAASEQ